MNGIHILKMYLILANQFLIHIVEAWPVKIPEIYFSDRFHVSNHKRPECKVLYNPNTEDLKGVNTQICEQV